MAATRVYVVSLITIGEAEELLVRATSPAAAISWVTRNMFRARVASQDDLIDILPKCDVQDATRDFLDDADPSLIDGGTAR